VATLLVDGYRDGERFDLIVVDVQGVKLEASTAVRYELMREAAAKAGIRLIAREGWRSFARQNAIYESRRCKCGKPGGKHAANCVVAVKGPAAHPGHSGHQAGEAVDLSVGMTVADLAARRTTPAFEWLELHAGEYGFQRTVKVEPWHWQNTAIQEIRDA